jgi:glycosyltransferase involved in cell wall biosynthesis
MKAIINYSSAQMEIGADRLGVPREKLHHALQPVDERFWRPQETPVEELICSVGAEARDYGTLVEAVRGLDVRVELAVGTTVLKTGDLATDLAAALRPIVAPGRPPNVELRQQVDQLELRELYARSRFAVVPTEDVEFDAGVTTIAEAMAMGKAVVVSRAHGQVDLVREGQTGLYVPPDDPRALRVAIEHLLAHPAEAERMGRAGRALVEARLTLDRWISGVVAVTSSA